MVGTLAVAVGGVVGCLLRFFLNTTMNALFPAIPPGTLTANLVGSYLIGVAMAAFAANPEWPVEWRLLLVTGVLGGFTTFSAFAGEVTALLREGRTSMACVAIALHVGGGLLLTFAGIASVELLRR